MARSLWSGSLSFGLVNVPVRLHSAVKDRDLHFRQLHGTDGVPIEQKRFCSKEDKEVAWEEIAHGYDLDGELVVLTDEELALAQPRKTHTIDIEQFVDLADVDPMYFDHPYFLVPTDTEGAARAYRLLVEAMEAGGRAALGRVVLFSKEYLVLIRVREGRMALTTMLWHDEVRPRDDVETPGGKGARKEIEQAVALIEALTVDWDPSRYQDRHRRRLRELVKKKQKGETIKAPGKATEPEPVPDLMAALERSLADAKKKAASAKARPREKARA